MSKNGASDADSGVENLVRDWCANIKKYKFSKIAAGSAKINFDVFALTVVGIQYAYGLWQKALYVSVRKT